MSTEEPGRDQWSAPGGEGSEDHDTTWVEHAPTAPVGPDPETVVLGDQPTLVDPSTAAAPAPPQPQPQPPQPAAPPPAWGPPSTPASGQSAWSGAALPGVAGWGAVPEAPKPGVVPLRPLGLGEILDGAISYIRRDPKTVLGISTVLALVVAVVQFVATLAQGGTPFDPSFGTGTIDDQAAISEVTGAVVASVVPALVSGLLQVLATGMLTVAMGQAVLGRRVTTREAWDRTRPRFWALLGVTLLIGLVIGVVGIGGVALAVLVGMAVYSSAGGGFAFLLGFALGVVALVAATWLAIRLLLAPVALVLERAGVLESLRRSSLLVKGAWWRTFGIWLLAAILTQLISSVLSFPLAVVAGLASVAGSAGTASLLYAAATSLAVLLSSIITLPFSAGVTSLLYIDRRIRREALDLELVRAAGVGR